MVEAQSGSYFEGPIHTDVKHHDNLEVQTTYARHLSCHNSKSFRVRQYGRATLDRLKFAIDYGFTYARSNQQTQSTLHSNIEYRSEEVLTCGEIDSLFVEPVPKTPTQIVTMDRHSTTGGFKGRDGTADGRATSSQTIHRISGSGSRMAVGVLRNVFTTNRNTLLAQAGVVYTHERFTVPEPDGARYNNAEAAFGIRYSTFRFDSTQFVTNLIVYPSLTQSGRVRSAADLSLYLKVYRRFLQRFGFYSNFDSRPPNNTAKHDYGSSTSLGWSF